MLLKKLFQYLPMTESQALQSTAALKSLAANFHGNLPPTVLGPVPPSEHPPPQYAKKKKSSKVISAKKKKESTPRQGLIVLIIITSYTAFFYVYQTFGFMNCGLARREALDFNFTYSSIMISYLCVLS